MCSHRLSPSVSTKVGSAFVASCLQDVQQHRQETTVALRQCTRAALRHGLTVNIKKARGALEVKAHSRVTSVLSRQSQTCVSPILYYGSENNWRVMWLGLILYCGKKTCVSSILYYGSENNWRVMWLGLILYWEESFEIRPVYLQSSTMGVRIIGE